MNHKIAVFCGLLGLAASLQASESVWLGSQSGNLQIGSDLISPYTGTLGSSATNPLSNNPAVELYCDDFNNGVNSSGWTVNLTGFTSAGALTNVAGYSTDAARYETSSGGLNVPSGTAASGVTGFSLPSASALYDEMIWLATQMSDTGISNGDKIDIQEAIWALTGTGTPTQAGAGSYTYTYTFSQRILAAQANFADTTSTQDHNNGVTDGFTSGFLDPNYSYWQVVTETGYANNYSSSGYQEFLTYSGTGAPPTITTVVSVSPEPATFGLIGCGFLFGAMLVRRRKSS